MPQLTLPASAEGLPLTRRDIEQHVDALIDLLDTIDADPDLEPDLGSGDDREGDESDFEPDTDDEPTLGFIENNGWNHNQDTPDFHANADRGRGLEDEHDGGEPDVDSEPSLGWTDNVKQGCAAWLANHLGAPDLEDSVGPVRKKRPPSKTGGRIMIGAEVFR